MESLLALVSTLVVVYASDKNRVAAFYQATLQLAVVETAPGFILLKRDGIEVSIVQMSAAAQLEVGSPPVVREETPIKCSFLVEDFVALRAAALATGGGLKPAEAAWNWRGALHLDGWDPEGNVIQFRMAEAQAEGK